MVANTFGKNSDEVYYGIVKTRNLVIRFSREKTREIKLKHRKFISPKFDYFHSKLHKTYRLLAKELCLDPGQCKLTNFTVTESAVFR